MNSFLWHDYETFGANPSIDKPAQFAAIRTDENLEPINEPMMWYCKPPLDYVPQPEASLITGITPQHALEHGLTEAEFMANIYQQMIQPGTCTVGFNNIRFDDEVTRFSLFRNFYDPYAREWQNGNSRFDLIDVVRMCAALRPEGINWPKDDDSKPVFKLEELTAANNIEQKGAHDALVDVRATISVAKLIKDTQPKLWQYALSMRDKQQVANALKLSEAKPVLHTSGMFGNENYCLSAVLPLCPHPSNKNQVLCFDLRHDPEEFINLSVAEIRERVFTSQKDLGDKPRIALKGVHINKCPMLAPIAMLSDDVAKRANLDKAKLREHYDKLLANKAVWLKAAEVFENAYSDAAPIENEEASLYSGGFLNNNDKQLLDAVRQKTAEDLADWQPPFSDPRLDQLLFLYKARNFPESLNAAEQQQWQAFRQTRITEGGKGLLALEDFQMQLESLFEKHIENEQAQDILGQLMQWGDYLLAQLD